jgi:hypothetical protein
MSYATLQDDIAAFIDNQDIANKIPTFIRLTESRMNRTIRTREMETAVTATITTQISALPADFLEYRRITLNGSQPIRLEYVTPQEADTIKESGKQGDPVFFTIVGNKIELIPFRECSISYVYYTKIPELSDSITSNWLLDRHYDLYLYGSLVQATLYLKDDPTAWATLFDSALSEIEIEDDRAQFHGTTPQIRGITIG